MGNQRAVERGLTIAERGPAGRRAEVDAGHGGASRSCADNWPSCRDSPTGRRRKAGGCVGDSGACRASNRCFRPVGSPRGRGGL